MGSCAACFFWSCFLADIFYDDQILFLYFVLTYILTQNENFTLYSFEYMLCLFLYDLHIIHKSTVCTKPEKRVHYFECVIFTTACRYSNK